MKDFCCKGNITLRSSFWFTIKGFCADVEVRTSNFIKCQHCIEILKITRFDLVHAQKLSISCIYHFDLPPSVYNLLIFVKASDTSSRKSFHKA